MTGRALLLVEPADEALDGFGYTLLVWCRLSTWPGSFSPC